MTTLVPILQHALARHGQGPLCVAYSGGPDSTALLHALAQLPQVRTRGLRALHVDHGLHADSTAWAQHCRQVCRDWQVPLTVLTVQVDKTLGIGVEAAARDARYTALAGALHAGEILLTAQHQDDQAETVLLKLLRGAGPEGLGGMRAWRSLGEAFLWRPLLDTPRHVLARYLREHGLDSIDDPSNRSDALARSYLRSEILPRLQSHWPKTAGALSHGARLQRQTADYLAEQAATALHNLLRPADRSLDAPAWQALQPALHMPVLEQWLHGLGLSAPGLAHGQQLRTQIGYAHGGRVPLVQWPGTAVHIWRGRLHAHRPLPEVPVDWRTRWQDKTLPLPAASGTLHWHTDSDKASPLPELDVRLGHTGMRLKPTGSPHTRELRDLFQQAGVPPWLRRRCPLLYHPDGQLLAVADLWTTEPGRQYFAEHGGHPQWRLDWWPGHCLVSVSALLSPA